MMAKNSFLNRKIMIVVACCLIFYQHGFLNAQTPVTDITFYKAYTDFHMVRKASKTDTLTPEIAKFLLRPEVSNDLKAAVVNAISFDILGKTNAKRFTFYLNIKYQNLAVKYKIDTNQYNAPELLCLGYFTLLDDYFDPGPAIDLLMKAKEKSPDDYTINFLILIAKSQGFINKDKCRAWKAYRSFRSNENLEHYLLPEAVQMAKGFFIRYEKYCDL